MKRDKQESLRLAVLSLGSTVEEVKATVRPWIPEAKRLQEKNHQVDVISSVCQICLLAIALSEMTGEDISVGLYTAWFTKDPRTEGERLGLHVRHVISWFDAGCPQ